MNFPTAPFIEYFLWNQEGISEEQIALMRSHVTFEDTVVPYIEEIASKLKAHGQNLEAIERNKNLLIGVA
jgi:hypothetical protein